MHPLIKFAIVALLVYILWKAPTALADGTKGILAVAESFANSVVVFFRSLFA